MKRVAPSVAWVVAGFAGGFGVGCTQHKVEVAPIEVKPIHMTVDINIKVDRELDEFFDFEDTVAAEPMPVSQGTAPATQPGDAPGQGVQQ